MTVRKCAHRTWKYEGEVASITRWQFLVVFHRRFSICGQRRTILAGANTNAERSGARPACEYHCHRGVRLWARLHWHRPGCPPSRGFGAQIWPTVRVQQILCHFVVLEEICAKLVGEGDGEGRGSGICFLQCWDFAHKEK